MYAVIPVTIVFIKLQYTGKSTLLQMWGHFILSKKKETAYGYEEVLKKHDRSIIESYNLVETETEIYITEYVNNILFVKI